MSVADPASLSSAAHYHWGSSLWVESLDNNYSYKAWYEGHWLNPKLVCLHSVYLTLTVDTTSAMASKCVSVDGVVDAKVVCTRVMHKPGMDYLKQQYEFDSF